MRVTVVFRAITRNWVRSRRGLFFSFLFPVAFLLVFGSLFSGTGNGSLSLTVQNLDVSGGSPTGLSQGFIAALNQTQVLSVNVISPSVSIASYIKNETGFFGSDPRVLVIPPGFSADVTSRPPVPVNLTFISEPDDQAAPDVEGVISSVATGFDFRIANTSQLIKLSSQPTSTRPLKTIDYYVPGLIAAFMMTNGVIGLTNIATEFKRTGLTKRLSATPLTKMEWITGNVLSQGLLALMLAALMIVLAKALFASDVTINLITVVTLVAGAITFAGIGMTLSGLVTDPESAVGLGNAVAFPMMFLSGTFFPLAFGPGYLQTIAKVLPLTYFSDALRDSMVVGNASASVVNLGATAAFGVAFILVGAKVTTWKQD